MQKNSYEAWEKKKKKDIKIVENKIYFDIATRII